LEDDPFCCRWTPRVLTDRQRQRLVMVHITEDWHQSQVMTNQILRRQNMLPCALTLTAYIQFPLMFLFPLFCRPFGGQKPASVVDHGIWFFIKPDPFSRNVIRDCMIFYFQSILINDVIWVVPISSK
jgi:hypothetical protein